MHHFTFLFIFNKHKHKGQYEHKNKHKHKPKPKHKRKHKRLDNKEKDKGTLHDLQQGASTCQFSFLVTLILSFFCLCFNEYESGIRPRLLFTGHFCCCHKNLVYRPLANI